MTARRPRHSRRRLTNPVSGARVLRLLRVALTVGVAAIATPGCAAAPQVPEQGGPSGIESAESLERLREAALDFERARVAGDALAMAHAAAARQHVDRVLRMEAEAADEDAFLTARRMFADARAAAGEDRDLLQTIERIEAESLSVLLGRFGALSKRVQPPKVLARPIDEQEAMQEGRRLPARSLPLAALPASGAVVTIGARESVWLRAEVARQRTLFVYVESKAGMAVNLRIVDAGTGAQICADAQAHGFLLCRWRVEQPSTGVVVVSNTGAQPAAVLLIAHQ